MVQNGLQACIKHIEKKEVLLNLSHAEFILGSIKKHIDGLVQDCSNSSALAMELLQIGAKSLIYWHFYNFLTLNKWSRFNYVNIMAADALAPYVTRTSAAMTLII